MTIERMCGEQGPVDLYRSNVEVEVRLAPGEWVALAVDSDGANLDGVVLCCTDAVVKDCILVQSVLAQRRE